MQREWTKVMRENGQEMARSGQKLGKVANNLL